MEVRLRHAREAVRAQLARVHGVDHAGDMQRAVLGVGLGLGLG